MPSCTIAAVEMMLSTTFWAVPAFSRVEPAMISGPTSTSIAIMRGRAERRAVVAGETDSQGARLGGGGDRAEDVRRATARRDPDDDVVRRDAEPRDRCRASHSVVLRVLDGNLERARASGEHTDDLSERDVEGGPRLGRVEHAQTSGRAGADVDQAASAFEPLDDALDGPHDRGLDCDDGVRDTLHVGAHERDEPLDRELVELGQLGPDLLGAEPAKIGDVARLAHASASAIRRCTTRRSSSASSRRRTGCTPPISSTTPMPTSGATSSDVPVKPVCQ